jgi:hypothetical protein
VHLYTQLDPLVEGQALEVNNTIACYRLNPCKCKQVGENKECVKQAEYTIYQLNVYAIANPATVCNEQGPGGPGGP